MRELIEISDRRTANVFANLRQQHILMLLIEGEHSLSELARITKIPLNLLHHHVNRFISLGLVRLTRKKYRAGLAIKYYRATAKTFFVPAKLMSDYPNASLAHKLRSALEKGVTGAYKGISYFHDGANARVQLVNNPQCSSNAFEIWAELRLTEADTRELAKDLRIVLERYKARSGRLRRAYIVHSAIAAV